MLESYSLNVRTKGGLCKFGLAEVFARPVSHDMVHLEGPTPRDPNYEHPEFKKQLSSELAAECAADRAQILIEEIEEDEKDEAAAMSAECSRLSQEKSETVGKALSAMGRSEWIIDSGSTLDILAPSDIPSSDRSKVYKLASPVYMNTADGQV